MLIYKFFKIIQQKINFNKIYLTIKSKNKQFITNNDQITKINFFKEMHYTSKKSCKGCRIVIYSSQARQMPSFCGTGAIISIFSLVTG